MAKKSEWGPQIEQYIAQHGPVSAAEVIEQLGCSRQTVYNWIRTNRGHVRARGKSDYGSVLYEINQNHTPTNGVERPDIGGGTGIAMGDSVTIVGMRFLGGSWVLQLAAEDGTELVVKVEQ
jgi:hypothetical protein